MTAFSAAAHDEGGDTTKALRARITELEDMLANLPLSAPQRLRARIQQLEKMLAAVGAGGVGPLIPATVQHHREPNNDNELQSENGQLSTSSSTATAAWKTVPVVPTTRMVDAARSQSSFPAGVWRAMLAAAPQPPEHYDQQELDLCLTCGWKTLIPGDCCLICARQKPQVEQEPVETFDEVWDAIDWGKWRMAPIRELVREIHSKTSPQPKRKPRTDREIIDQTEGLAGLLMRAFHQREKADSLSTFRDSLDIRARHCWLLACQIQEMLTDTDPENAASELENGIGGEA